MKTRVKHIKYKGLALSGILVIFWTAILLRLFDIQVKNNEDYRNFSLSMSHKKQVVQPERGLISDRKGRKLATNSTRYSLGVHPPQINKKKKMARQFANFLNIPYNQLYRKISSNKKFVWLDRDISEAAADSIKKYYKDPRQLQLHSRKTRRYPYNDLAGQLLGFTNVDNVGLEGLEKELNHHLSGTPGYKIYFRTGRGKKETRPNFPFKPPINGKNIDLTIDIEYQNILHEEILSVLNKFNADKAMGILLDPNSGEILAMASAPVIDPNNYAKYPRKNRKNILVTDVYEPGSTFKIITATAALEEGIVTPKDTINTHDGYIVIQTETIRDHVTLPDMSFADVIRHSSNVGTIRVAQKMGTHTLFHYVRRFGFGSKTNIRLPGEVKGIMKKINGWTPLRTAQISMGQGIGCTALQMAYAYAAIANGGLLLKPRIIQSITDPTGKKIYNHKTIIRRVASQKTTAVMRELLLNTVNQGTGRKAKIGGMDIAGKTGTAQKIKPGGGYSQSEYVASFFGFFPARNPKLLCAVIVDNPKGPVYYGSSVAAPIVKNVFKRVTNMSEDIYFENQDKKNNETQLVSVTSKPKSTISIYTRKSVGVKQEKFPMPNLIGLSLTRAIDECEYYGLELKTEGSGKVIKQIPRARKIISTGTKCTLILSTQS